MLPDRSSARKNSKSKNGNPGGSNFRQLSLSTSSIPRRRSIRIMPRSNPNHLRLRETVGNSPRSLYARTAIVPRRLPTNLSATAPIVAQAGGATYQPQGDRAQRGDGEERPEGTSFGQWCGRGGRDAAAGEHRAGEERDHGGPRLGKYFGGPGLKGGVHEGESASDEDGEARREGR